MSVSRTLNDNEEETTCTCDGWGRNIIRTCPRGYGERSIALYGCCFSHPPLLPSPCVAFCQSDIFSQLNSGPFSVTLCCHVWLLQPRHWCTRTVGGKWYAANHQVIFPGLHQKHRIPLNAEIKTKGRQFLSGCHLYSRIEKKSDTLAFDICSSLKLMQICEINATLTFTTKHNSQSELLFP